MVLTPPEEGGTAPDTTRLTCALHTRTWVKGLPTSPILVKKQEQKKFHLSDNLLY